MRRDRRLAVILVSLFCVVSASAQQASAPAAQSAPTADQPAVYETAPTPLSTQKSFGDVTAGAKRIEGFLPVWVKDDRFWIELREEDFERPMFFAIQHVHGTGERGVWSSAMGGAGIVTFRRFADRVQMVALNSGFQARGSTAMELAVKQSFPESLMATVGIASKPDPDSKAILVEAGSLLLNDFASMSTTLESVYRQSYAYDRSNSAITRLRSHAGETGFEMRAHYALGRLSVPPPGQAAATPLPRTAPDPRSLLMGFHYSFSPLPELMSSRIADPRVGYFHVTRWDYSDDLAPSPRVRHIQRWRLQKKDPAAALSEPVKPITFWIDRNVPERYRNAVREGILMWNPAFERIGYKDAIVVQQQPDDAPWTTLDRNHASVRWFLSTDTVIAFGPRHVDPRSGEILDADIMVSEGWTRTARNERTRNMPLHLRPPGGAALATMVDQLHAQFHTHGDGQPCDFAEQAFEDMLGSLDAMIASGQVSPDGEDADSFVRQVLRNVVAHEVGHALGLAHNFRGSSAYSLAQLRDPAFVGQHGTSASVMDYVPTNVGLLGEPEVPAIQRTLGPYDYWAIEYGYREFEPAAEATELAALARRGETDPLLAYAGDADADGIDPRIARFDLGDDPRAWFERRLRVTRELWDWIARLDLGNAGRYAQPRASVSRSLALLSIDASNLARTVGGLSLSRRTSTVDRPPLEPIPASTQRAALDALSRGLFVTDGLAMSPQLLARLVPDHLDRWDGSGSSPAFPLSATLLRLQQNVLDRLFSEQVAQRLLEADQLPTSEAPLGIAELYGRVQRDIWSELGSARGDIGTSRRDLQRAHLARLTAMVARPSPGQPADARSLARAQTLQLQADITRALRRPGLSAETRAHLAESLANIEDALRATLLKIPS